MEIMFGMFPFAFQVFNTQKYEVAIFTKLKSACAHARPLRYLEVPYFLEHMHHACMLHITIEQHYYSPTFI